MKNSNRIRGTVGLFSVIAVVAMISSPVAAEEEDRGRRLHTPAEIFKIMEESSVIYKVNIDETLEYEPPYEPRVLSNQFYLKEDEGGGHSLHEYELSEKGKKLLDRGREAFTNKKYDEALDLYQLLRKAEPEFNHILTMIGDIHYVKQDYDRAKTYFLRSIEANFIDYDAHWFLADTYWKMGERDLALQHITIAHLLNYHHENVKKRLMEYREAVGRPWNGWTYEPLYRLSKSGDEVDVVFHLDWLGYAMVKAVWAYEPGYAESMGGVDYSREVLNMDEEKEALLSMMVAAEKNEKFSHLGKIVEEGFVPEFIIYELLVKQVPEAALLLPRDVFLKTIDYVDRYH